MGIAYQCSKASFLKICIALDRYYYICTIVQVCPKFNAKREFWSEASKKISISVTNKRNNRL